MGVGVVIFIYIRYYKMARYERWEWGSELDKSAQKSITKCAIAMVFFVRKGFDEGDQRCKKKAKYKGLRPLLQD